MKISLYAPEGVSLWTLSCAMSRVLWRLWPIKQYSAGGRKTGVWGTGTVYQKLPVHVLSFGSLYIDSPQNNHVPRLLMSQASWTWERNCTIPQTWFFRRKEQRSQKSSRDSVGRRESRTSAFAIKMPNCGQRVPRHHWDCHSGIVTASVWLYTGVWKPRHRRWLSNRDGHSYL